MLRSGVLSFSLNPTHNPSLRVEWQTRTEDSITKPLCVEGVVGVKESERERGGQRQRQADSQTDGEILRERRGAVSYTHLTLPTRR